MMRSRLAIFVSFLTAAGVLAGSAAVVGAAGPGGDDRLAEARKFVEKSDRYLHHSKLKRGMQGYGLTVMAGTKRERFKARVISVVTKWGPHQDVILARLSGLNLEHSGIIAGMSGSPVYFKDPADGKDKLVGAVAYGWSGQKDPLCGIQPITQMLASGRTFAHLQPITPSGPGDKSKPVGGKSAKRGPDRKVEAKSADSAAAGLAGGALPNGLDVDSFVANVLSPEKADFAALVTPKRTAEPVATSMVPLVTPLMMSGFSQKSLAAAAGRLEPLGLMPVASGGINADLDKSYRTTKLVPGGGIAVPIVSGDAAIAAVGTVTDVYKGRVMAFGHSFQAEGATDLPIAPAYIHTVVPGLMRSFKMGASLKVQGRLHSDEAVGISGQIGPKPRMVPMTLTIHRKDIARKEVYHYEICNHRSMTALGVSMVLGRAVEGWHAMPEQHTIRYRVAVDFGRLGKYEASNLSADLGARAVGSDVLRPITAMLSNPFGVRIVPNRIDVAITVEPRSMAAQLLEFKLNASTYRPGDTVTGVVTVRPVRKAPRPVAVKFRLPDDLPDGSYTLTVCDAISAMQAEQAENPHRFAPRTTEQLFEAVQRVVSNRSDRLYLRLPLPGRVGVAIEQAEMPDLPASKVQILAQAGIRDARAFKRCEVQTNRTPLLISGSATATFGVEREPEGTILRK